MAHASKPWRVAAAIASLIAAWLHLGSVVLQPHFPGNISLFWVLSSGLCLLLGGLFTIGLYPWWSRP